ncbi:MAG: hypothetical protein BMS9Abin36_1231 [Gammaproteobacteria bacterium]|nr:MAG: hypothetical protein BMS9Abin36_1231 [Gammaproteobacteria bacterium]
MLYNRLKSYGTGKPGSILNACENSGYNQRVKKETGKETPAPLITQDLTEIGSGLRTAAALVVNAYSAAETMSPQQTPPTDLAAGIEQFMEVAQRLEQNTDPDAPAESKDISQIGDYGIQLIAGLGNWADELGLHETTEQLGKLILAVAGWIARQNGEIHSLDAVVDAIAGLANHLFDPESLVALLHFSDSLMDAIPMHMKDQTSDTNPSRPWRVLLLNRGIIATRSRNTEAMEQVYDQLIRHLPGDAEEFFSESMQQTTLQKYPAHIQAVVKRYYDRFTHRHMH